jgi:hypothetical protein
VHVNTCESHTSLARRWLLPHRGISRDKLTPYLRALQFPKRVRRKPGDRALKLSSKLHYDATNNRLLKSVLLYDSAAAYSVRKSIKPRQLWLLYCYCAPTHERTIC